MRKIFFLIKRGLQCGSGSDLLAQRDQKKKKIPMQRPSRGNQRTPMQHLSRGSQRILMHRPSQRKKKIQTRPNQHASASGKMMTRTTQIRKVHPQRRRGSPKRKKTERKATTRTPRPRPRRRTTRTWRTWRTLNSTSRPSPSGYVLARALCECGADRCH